MDRYLRLEQHEGEINMLPLHIRQVQSLQVLQQIREREWLRLRLLQVSELPVRFGEMMVSNPRIVLRMVASVISPLLFGASFVRK